MNKKHTQWIWFIGGFALGFTLISIGHAAMQKKAAALSELKANKAGTPELEQDFSRLTSLESRYAESSEQQKKIKAAVLKTTKNSRSKN